MKRVTIEVSERLRLQAEHDGLTLADAVRRAVAYWIDVREDSIAAGKRSDERRAEYLRAGGER
jgi:hypothetical protein